MTGMEPSTWVYVTASERPSGEAGPIHLIDFDRAFSVTAATICGRPVELDWEYGDETVAGIEATCGTCRRIARPDLPSLR